MANSIRTYIIHAYADSAWAYGIDVKTGELLEVEVFGTPNWDDAGICNADAMGRSEFERLYGCLVESSALFPPAMKKDEGDK